MRAGEPQMYAALAAMRNGYIQTQWNRLQILIIFNSMALPVVFSVTPNVSVSRAGRMYLSIMAFFIHAVLINGVWRADRWISYIDKKLKALELIDEGESDLLSTRVKFFSDAKFEKKRKSIFSSRRLFGIIWYLITFLWLYLAFRYHLLDTQIAR